MTSMSSSSCPTTVTKSLAKAVGGFMRLSVAVAIGCLSLTGMSVAEDVRAAVREAIHIPAQGLGPALQTLAKQRGFQIVYVSDEVNSLRTQGATGELTIEEALMQLLSGTGLTYRVFSDDAIGIVPAKGSSSAPGAGAATISSTKEGGSSAAGAATQQQRAGRMHLAQSSAAMTSGANSVAPDGAAAIDTIVVTGSRIQRDGFTTPTPVTVVDAAALESRSTTNVANYLNDLPAFVPTQTPTTNSAATGGVGNYLNLRALGGERTLVLVDGRRHVPTTSVGTVSINVIPALLVERIEVVTGGASAAYGSDAVAGVVNLIFDHDLEGFRGEAQSGIAEEGDNEEWRAALAYGTSFADGRGHFSIAAEAFDNDGVRYQRDRDWGAREWGIVLNPSYAPGNGEPMKVLRPNTGLTIATEGGLILSGSLAGRQFLPDGSLAPFNPGIAAPGGMVAEGGDGPYTGGQAVLAVPLKRHNVFARARYDLTDSVTGFLEASYAEQESNNRNLVQPFSFGDLFITADNAFLPSAVRMHLADTGEPGFVFSRLHTDFGFVEANDKLETRRAVAGLRGELGSGWTWDAYYQYGQSDRANIDPGNVIMANFALAVDSVVDSVTGAPVCRSRAAGCVPINLFGFGAPSQAALDYIHGTASVLTDVEQEVVAASMQGRPFDTWAGPLSIAFGAEYREDSVSTTVDEISLNDGFMIGNQKPVEGSISVKEAFAEAVVPLLSGLPWAQQLEIDLAARLTDYSTSGSVTTWKAGLSHSFNDSVRIRGTRSRDIRAPNVFELFSKSGTGFWPVTHPVTGENLLVRSTLLPNLDLVPEEADTTVLGIVLQPSFIPGLRFSADHFDIKLRNAIGQLAPPEILDRCVAGAVELCDFIVSDDQGNITAINRSQLNLVRRRIRGIDFEVQYSLPLSSLGFATDGVLALRALATYTSELSYDDGGGRVDQAGALAGLPRVRGYGSISYVDGPLIAHLGARYVGSADRDKTDFPLEFEPDHFPSQVYFDASLQYSILSRANRKVQLFGGVTNLLDKDPVLTGVDVFFSAATNPRYYDVIGRSYNAGVRVQF
ncbi:MAG TPA: TonB-dependent receptor [Steroidobacter sp.]